MRKKILIILSVYFIILITGLVSCEIINPCGPFPDKYAVSSLDWQLYSAIYSETEDMKLNISELETDTVDYREFALKIVPYYQTYFSKNQSNAPFEFLTSAYACSPVDPTTDDIIDSIKIFCTSDYNSDYQAGTDISGLFYLIVYDQSGNINFQRFGLNEFTSSRPTVPTEMFLMLKESPDAMKEIEFNVKYYQEGKEMDYFEFKTNKITIDRGYE